MKTFVINLDKEKARMASIEAQLSQLGVVYERISAVYGKELPLQERNQAVNKFRWWCAIGRPIAVAEIGCALSHFSIYQRMVEESIPYACILEDDITISSKFKECIAQVEFVLDSTKPQVVLLSDHTKLYGDVLGADSFELRKSKTGTCADGYCLTQEAAKVLLKQNLPLITPCDTWERWVRQGVIELFHALPSVCQQVQALFGSSTSEGRAYTMSFPLHKWLFHKSKRVVGKVIDFVLQKWTGR